MIIAGLSWHLMAYRPTRRLEVQHGDLCREQIALHPLALAGLLTLQKRHQNAHCTKDAGGEVGNRNADAHGPLSRKSGDRHQPAHALRDLVEAGTFAVRPVLTEARDACIDQPRIDRSQVRIVDTEAKFHIRAVVLHQYVGVAHQALQDRHALCGLQVERHAAFVAVQVLEVRAMPFAAHSCIALRRLDLDDFSAPIGKLPHRSRPGADAGQVDHLEAGEGTLAQWSDHWALSS